MSTKGRTTIVLFALLLPLFLADPALCDEHPLQAIYQPAESILVEQTRIIFHSRNFTYEWDRETQEWDIEPRKKPLPIRPAGQIKLDVYDEPFKSEYELEITSDKNSADVEIFLRRDNSQKVLGDFRLYSRDQVAGTWASKYEDEFSTHTLYKSSFEVARPWVADYVDDGRFLWFTTGYEATGDTLGMATIIRVDRLLGEVKLFHHPMFDTTSLTHLAVADFGLWMGAESFTKDGRRASLGLVRFEPVSNSVVSLRPENSPLLGNVVTALASVNDTLWIGTDEGICRLVLPQGVWTRWRMIPEVIIRESRPLSSIPGEPAREALRRGRYEVRWATQDSLFVVSRNSIEGWVSPEKKDYLEISNHYANAYYFNTQEGEPPWIEFRQEPRSDAPVTALVYRLSLKMLPLKTGDKWQKAKTTGGWIPREGLAIEPQLVEVPIEETE